MGTCIIIHLDLLSFYLSTSRKNTQCCQNACYVYNSFYKKSPGNRTIWVFHISPQSFFYQSTLIVHVQKLAKYERITILLIVLLSGCRKLKHYGTNCSIPCPRNCLYDVCDIMNGDCPGCVAGDKGRKCNESMYLDSIYNIIHINLSLLLIYEILLPNECSAQFFCFV